jgi:hypothetical protein
MQSLCNYALMLDKEYAFERSPTILCWYIQIMRGVGEPIHWYESCAADGVVLDAPYDKGIDV